MNQLQNEPDPTIRVTTCHAGTLLIRFSSQYRLDSWMSLFSEEDLQALSARSASTSSTNSNPPFASGYSSGGGGLGGRAAVRRRSATLDGVPDFMNQPVMNMHSSGISPEMSDMGIPGLGGTPYSDPPMAPPEPPSWTSKLSISNSLYRLWNRKDYAKSTSEASNQSVYMANNNFSLNYNQFPPSSQDQFGVHPHHLGVGGEFYEDMSNEASRWSRAGGEWSSTDSNASNFIPTGRQSNANHRENSNSYIHRKSLKNQAPFLGMGMGETVIEDREGERKSPPAQMNIDMTGTAHPGAVPVAGSTAPISPILAAAHPSAPLADISADNISLSNPSQGEDTIKDQKIPSVTPSQESQESGVSHTAEGAAKSIQSETTSMGAMPRPLSSQTLDKSTPVDIDDDDDDDNLYDPEFGIGGGQRRRRRRTKPSRLNTNQSVSGNAAIPSAAVISAAAAAVSAGWSETEALAAAMANSPALSQLLPHSATSPAIQGNRSRNGSQASSIGSYFRLGGNRPRKESVGEGYLSSNSASSMYSNHVGDLSGSGAGHVVTRIYTDRVNMSPAGGRNAKRMSAGASSILLSPAPSTPQSLSATTPTASPSVPSPRRALGDPLGG